MAAVRKMELVRVTGVLALVTLCCSTGQVRAADPYPFYAAEGIVNAATQTAIALAPNTIATIYGTNLAFSTYSVAPADVRGGYLPATLGGVTVYVGSIRAALFYISPTQINFLVPYELLPGPVNIIVARQAAAGPAVKVQLNATSPGLFLWSGNCAIASHLSGTIIGPETPALPGEIIILYVVGLGRVSPDTLTGRLVSSAAKIVALAQLQVTIGGVAVRPADILYAGLAPGFAGLYQVNLRLPIAMPSNPEIRVAVGSQVSLPEVQLSAKGAIVVE
ncbi:MAG: hypothetical protein JWN34_5536 [Bryobacterales bacterium]|nr:hypothetical protein [Bryobacterales bacterium]